MVEQHLCIFSRAPVLGQVKSRIAAVAGTEMALVVHIELMDRLLSRVAVRTAVKDNYRAELWVTDLSEANSFVDRWLADYPLTLCVQQGENLGERMDMALRSVVAVGGTAVLIGCDCPQLDLIYVNSAFAALEQSDVVLGPAEDGGYGLIGVKADWPHLFHDIPWGTNEVLSSTLRRAVESGASVHMLDTLFDVDTMDDWQRYCSLEDSGITTDR